MWEIVPHNTPTSFVAAGCDRTNLTMTILPKHLISCLFFFLSIYQGCFGLFPFHLYHGMAAPGSASTFSVACPPSARLSPLGGRNYARLPCQSDHSAGNKQQQRLPYTETINRSILKTLTWKVLSALVTLQTTMVFTQSWTDAVKVTTISFLPKFLVLFVMDRAVNRHASAMRISSRLRRSLIKVFVWRVCSLMANLLLATVLLRDSVKASKIVSADFALKIFLSVVYERAWAQIDWGKENLTPDNGHLQ